MTVNYYTGTATGPDDLLDKIRIALAANGWTINNHSADGTGYRLHVQKTLGGEASYFNLRSAISEAIFPDESNISSSYVTGIGLSGSTGYDIGNDWEYQPTVYTRNELQANDPSGMVMSPMSTSAIPAYYIFIYENSVHIVVEVISGEFQMMSFGLLNKQGSYTGGQYITASHSSYYCNYCWSNSFMPRYLNIAGSAGSTNYNSSSGFLYADIDGSAYWRRGRYVSNNYQDSALHFSGCVGGNQATYDPSILTASFLNAFSRMSPSFYNSMAVMMPVYTFIRRTDLNFSLAGWPDGVRFLNVAYHSAGEEITYGTETWKVFPSNGMSASSSPSTYNPYGGFAFLKSDS